MSPDPRDSKASPPKEKPTTAEHREALKRALGTDDDTIDAIAWLLGKKP